MFARTRLAPWLGAFLLATPFALTACKSVHSTHVERDPNLCGWKSAHLRGVPVTIKIPTHIAVTVWETSYVDGAAQAFLKEDGKNIVTREVTTQIRERNEIITVDAARPPAGLGKMNSALSNQFFTKIEGQIEDQTIQAITYSIAKLTGQSGTAPTRVTPTADLLGGSNFEKLKTIIAVRHFELHDPELQIKIHDFLRSYLNDCNPPCPPHSVSKSVLPHPVLVMPPADSSEAIGPAPKP